MNDDILEDIGEVDDNEKEELEVYEDKHKEDKIKDNSKYAPKNANGGRPKGSPNKNKGPMGEEMDDVPSGQNEVDDYEEALRKEEEAANQESQPKVRMPPEEEISIVVVKELPMVPQREGVDESGRKIRFVTTEEFLTMLANR